ncbi:MAG: ECF-type sigma factor [Gemmatimonadales bacterium]
MEVTEDATGTGPGTLTALLSELNRGNRDALIALFPIVYEELRRLAHRERQRWQGDSTIGTTALVHEAYLKLANTDRLGAKSSIHFRRIAAMAMRQILCNYARDRRALRRGGKVVIQSLDDTGSDSVGVAMDSTSDTLADLDDALRRLEEVEPRLSHVVECRFFGGLELQETAEALGVSVATVKRDWSLARAWLYRELQETGRE